MNDEFSPSNKIVKMCMQAIYAYENNEFDKAIVLLEDAYKCSETEFEKFVSSYKKAEYENDLNNKLKWFEISIKHAINSDCISSKTAYSTLYLNIAKTYEKLNELENAKKNYDLSNKYKEMPQDNGPFYHGTNVNLNVGDLLSAGRKSNYKDGLVMNHIYFTSNLSGAILAAKLVSEDNMGHVYVVKPIGDFENDPNVTDKKFCGNLTQSYRTTSDLEIICELVDLDNNSSLDIKEFKEKIYKNDKEIIN